MTRLYIGIAIAVLISLGIIMTLLFVRSEPAATTDTWSTGGSFMPWRDSAPIEKPIEQPTGDRPVESLGVVPLPLPTAESTSAGFDELASLLQDLVQPSTAERSDTDPATPSSYAFIPQGLLSISGSAPQTPEQRALHEYGNSLGLSLRAFADLHPDMPQILKDQAEDRSGAAKVAAMKRLADDFTRLGDDIASMDTVPASVAASHQALAAAYRDVGTYLARIPDAQGDDAFLEAIYAYNTRSEELSRRLVTMVDIFVSRDVRFSATDPGSIFTFEANASF